MNQLYHVVGLGPVKQMGGCGFAVQLWPAWRDAIAERGLTAEDANNTVETMGREWLDGCGYDQTFDPDNCGYGANPTAKPGPNAGPLYRPNRELRVTWGEWGPEHITIPGNACGLDLDRGSPGSPPGGRVLLPHNVDGIRQAHLLLVVFLFFADTLVLDQTCKELGIPRGGEKMTEANS